MNVAFRRWQENYARQQERIQRFDQLSARLRGRVRIGRKLSREEMNAG